VTCNIFPSLSLHSSVIVSLAALAATHRALAQKLEARLSDTRALKSDAEKLAVQGIRYGRWPVEALAARRNLALSVLPGADGGGGGGGAGGGGAAGGAGGTSSGGNGGEDDRRTKLLQQAAANVDRIEQLSSPYLWEVLQEHEGRAQDLADRIDALGRQLRTAEMARGEPGGMHGGGGGIGVGGGGGRMLPPLLGMAALGGGSGGGGDGATMRTDLVVSYHSHPPFYPQPAPQSYEEELAAVARQQAEAFLRVAAVVSRSHDALDRIWDRHGWMIHLETSVRTAVGNPLREESLLLDPLDNCNEVNARVLDIASNVLRCSTDDLYVLFNGTPLRRSRTVEICKLGIHNNSTLTIFHRLRGGVIIAQNASGRKRSVSPHLNPCLFHYSTVLFQWLSSNNFH
jgi:hypothetical protein